MTVFMKSRNFSEIQQLPINNDKFGTINSKYFQQQRQQKFIRFPLTIIFALSAIIAIAGFALIVITLRNGAEILTNAQPLSTSNYNLIFRRWKRELYPVYKNDSAKIIAKMESYPPCKEECKKIREYLDKLESNSMKLYQHYQDLRDEIESLMYTCRNKVGERDNGYGKSNTNLESNMENEEDDAKKLSDQKENEKSLFIHKDIVPSSSNNNPVFIQPQIKNDTIPPTGPGGSFSSRENFLPTAPGEQLKTSHQTTVTLPGRVQQMCWYTPTYDERYIYSCGQFVSDRLFQGGRDSQQSWATDGVNIANVMHVPTAVSSPNPYYFPTLNGLPIIMPAKHQLYYPNGQFSQFFPIYNPQSGSVSIQNIPKTTKIVKQPYIIQRRPFNYDIQPIIATPYQFNPNFYCTYVPIPNIPKYTYEFPVVHGVAENVQRSNAWNPVMQDVFIVKKKGYQRNNTIIQEKLSRAEGGCKLDEIACRDGEKCVPQDDWCNGVVNCQDFSDELHCTCKTRINIEKNCDGYFDCPDGEDEQECFECPKNTFSCDDWKGNEPTVSCVDINRRCDGIQHCPNGKDEQHCSLINRDKQLQQNNIASNGEGFLFRNWHGKWYLVCPNEIFNKVWAQEGCDAEFGRLNSKAEIVYSKLPITNKELYIDIDVSGNIKLVNNCQKHFIKVLVRCAHIKCGVRKHHKDFEYHKLNLRYKRKNVDANNLYFTTVNGQNYVSLCEDEMHQRLTHSDGNNYAHSLYIDQSGGNALPRTTLFTEPYNAENQEFDSGMWSNILLQPFMGYKPRQQNLVNSQQMPYNNFRVKRQINNGYSSYTSGRVVGGTKSEPGQWPWLIALFKDGIFNCGGVIYRENIIITAAHCVVGFENHYFEISAGMLRRYSFSPQEQIRKVIKVIIHHAYNRADFSNDIALLMIDKNLVYNRWVLPICLVDNIYLPNPGTKCTAVGWGATYEHGHDPDHLHDVEVPIQSSCKYISDRASGDICAGYKKGGKDTCQGDSGGPLLCRTGNGDQWYLAGIVSHGKGCARFNEPGVYTRVALYLEWIHTSSVNLKKIGTSPLQDCPGLQCYMGKCIPKDDICNYKVNCLYGDDEHNCEDSLFINERKSSTFSDSLENNKTILYNSDQINRNKVDVTKTTIDGKLDSASNSYNLIISDIHRNDESINESNKYVNSEMSESISDNKHDKIFLHTNKSESKKSNLTCKNNNWNYLNSNSTKIIPTVNSESNNNCTVIFKSENSSEVSESFEWENPNTYNLIDTPDTTSTYVDNVLQIKNGEEMSTLGESTNEFLQKISTVDMIGSTDVIDEKVTELPSNTSQNTPLTPLKTVNFNRHTISQTVIKDISKLFHCKTIKQQIITSQVCDGILDCVDGTDEQNCTCSSKLKNLAPEKICDSFIDCLDHSDERNCSGVCKSGEFLCGRSRVCIDINNLCDGEQNCPLNEDEINCFTLMNGTQFKFDQGGKPILTPAGVAYYLKQDQWLPICLEENTKLLDKALNICQSLGFSEVLNYNRIPVRNFTVFSTYNNSYETLIISTSNNPNHISCNGLFVECSPFTSSKSKPWLTMINVEGKAHAVGILLTDSWVAVTTTTSLLNIMSGKVYLSVSLGGTNSSSSIVGPYEQSIAVNNITYVHNSLALLHLNKSAILNHFVIPMGINIRSQPLEEFCEGITLNNGKITYISLEKEIQNCEKGRKCFKVISVPEYCTENNINGVSGQVVCYSNYGAYLAAVFIQEDSFCQLDCFVSFKDITEIEENFFKILKETQINTYEIPECTSERCFHGECLNWNYIFDGIQQCPDGSDETEIMKIKKENYCAKNKNCSCGPNKFQCNSGECYNLNHYCDGKNDCSDGSDEKKNCHDSCILFLNATNPQYLCDGNQNCFEKDDETWELCEKKYNCSDKENFFLCEKSRNCIPKSFVCDNHIDCPQKEDEDACWSLDYSNGKETQGRLVARSYGIWYDACFDSPMNHNLHLEICNLLGYESVENATYEIVSKTMVTLDPFTKVNLNPNLQFVIRSNQSTAQLIKNGNCKSLYIECQ